MFNQYGQYGYYPQPQQANVLPRQQIIQVNGKASVDAIQLAPNSSILVMDTTAPMVWLCVSDGVGRVMATPYDICEHREQPAAETRADLEPRLAELETQITKLGERIAAYESDAGKPKSK